MSNSLRPHRLQPTRLPHPWDSPGKNTGMGCSIIYDKTPQSLSVQFSSVAHSCPTICDPMNRSTPGLPVHHQLPEFTQTLIHQVSDAIQPSHPLSSPSPPAPNPSQHQSLLQWVNSSHEVAKILEFQLQHHSFQRNPRADLLQNGLVGSPCSPRDSQESSPMPQFKSITLLAWKKCNCIVVSTFYGLALLWYWNENWHFQVLWALWCTSYWFML